MTDGGPAESVEDEAAGQGAAVEPLLELIGELDADARLQALTHSSWTDRRISSWGRLAFLGDSVLGLAVAEHLYELVMELEDTYGIAMSEDEAAKIETVGAAVDFVFARLPGD